MSSKTPEFLFVRPGDHVAIKKENCENTKEKDENYWVGQVIDCIGGARNPVLEELEIQIHGPCFKLPILTMERSL